MPADLPATPPIPELQARADTTIRLLEQAREGDTAALDALFARYIGPLRRWASGRMPRWARDASDTQDIVQDTLLQTLKRIGDFEPRREGALQAYLRQAVMNRIKDVLRRHGNLMQAHPSPAGFRIAAAASLLTNLSWSPSTLVGTKLYIRYRKSMVVELG